MLASPAIEGRIAAIKWRPFGQRMISIVYGIGQSTTIKAKIVREFTHDYKPGDRVYLIDSDVAVPEFPINRRRLYLDFEKHGLEPTGSYGVWLGGLSRDQAKSKEFECLSSMVDDWFTFVEDDVALTLLCVTNGNGNFRIGRDHIARV